MPICHVVIDIFPGADEKEKLDAVFASAPPWLLWFTFADYTAELLGLTLPDLSGVVGFARSKTNFDLWYGFPSGAFESRPWPDGPDNEPLARTDLKLLRAETEGPDNQMTPRERRRAQLLAALAEILAATVHGQLGFPVAAPDGQMTAAALVSFEDEDPAADLARCFLRLANLPSFALDRLSRYEAILWRQVSQILFALDALDRRKPQDRGRRFRRGHRQDPTAYERDEY